MARENRSGIFEIPQTPQLEDIFKVFGRRVKLSIRTNTVGTVQAYDPATNTATVRVDALEILKVTRPPVPPPGNPLSDPNIVGETTEQAPPIILPTVPVVINGTSSDYVSFPVVPGTTGTLHIMDRGLRSWLESLSDQAVDPVQSATHALQDAVFVPGLRPDRDPITPPIDLTATVVHSDTEIKLGRGGTLGVARLTDKTVADTSMQAFLTQLVITINQIAAILNAPAGPVVSAPGSVTPVVSPTDFGVINTASSKVKSE